MMIQARTNMFLRTAKEMATISRTAKTHTVTVSLALTLSGSLAVMSPQHREAQEKLGGAQRPKAPASPPQHIHTHSDAHTHKTQPQTLGNGSFRLLPWEVQDLNSTSDSGLSWLQSVML